jgi:hypothetical protein
MTEDIEETVVEDIEVHSSQPANITEVDSDADTMDPDALEVIEGFKSKIECVGQTLDTLRTVAGSWLIGIEEHRYTAKLREDIHEFVAEATLQWSLVLSVVDGPEMVDASYATSQIDLIEGISTKLTAEFVCLKEVAIKFIVAEKYMVEGYEKSDAKADKSDDEAASSSEPKRFCSR